jgi:hypothetical protein
MRISYPKFLISVRCLSNNDHRLLIVANIVANTKERPRLWETTLAVNAARRVVIRERRQLDPRVSWQDAINFDAMAMEYVQRFYFAK